MDIPKLTPNEQVKAALKDADRMEREASASDILEAACDYMVPLHLESKS